jgi:hypothetical protein
MTAVYAALLAAAVQPTPLDLLKQVRDHYQSLSSFSMRIEHQDSSGLFPGRYSQTLRWRRGGRFELLTTPKGNKKVPDFYADGRQVLWIRPGNEWTTGELVPDRNTMPSWEVSGGPIVSWLQNTHSGRFFFDPPQQMPLAWSSGPRVEWRGHRVREIVGKQIGRDREPGISFLVDDRHRLLIGLEHHSNGKLGWSLYADQKLNPKLPSGIGNSPAANRSPAAGGKRRARVGQEWHYTGTAMRSTRGKTASKHPFITTATVVGKRDGALEVIRFRQVSNVAFLPEASAVWLPESGGEGTRLPAGMLLPHEARLVEALHLPVPFADGLKPGDRRLSRSPLLAYSAPFPQTVPMLRRVVGTERVGPRRCARIERKLAVRLPWSAFGTRVLSYGEQFWVDQATGVLVKYQGAVRLRDGSEDGVATLSASLQLTEVRPLSASELQQRRQQAQLLAETARLLASRSGAVEEIHLRQAQARMQEFQRRFPRSPYAAAATSLGQSLRWHEGYLQRQQKREAARAAFLQQPAHAVSLKALDGKEQTLGEYRGKLVLLNFFASW